MKVYQVQNSSGYPAGVELTNPDAIFTSRENADEYIELVLVLEAGADKGEFSIIEL